MVTRHERGMGTTHMKCLVVTAHPDTASLCHSLARSVVETLIEAGHDVETEDLYQSGFPPSMTTAKRRSYKNKGVWQNKGVRDI